MPNYVPAMLSRLCPSGCGSATSPVTYTPPVPYPDTSSPSTLTTLVSPAEKTWIQQVIGSSLLFYARALDLSVLIAVYQLSSHQSTPTQHDLSAAHRLLNYVSSHRNPQKTIHPSSMALWACTDASFLSRPNSGSVAGCSVGLGDPPPYLLNSPRKPQTECQDQSDPCPYFPPSSTQPLFHPTHLCHPQRSPPCPLPTHTRGGCVCGRGGVRCHFWRWASVS